MHTTPTRRQPPQLVAPPEVRAHRDGPRLARIAGLLYLAIIASGLFAEVFVRGRLIEPDDATATAANILESPSLFRLGFAADLVMFLCDVALAVVLYQLLKPLSQTLSMVAAAFRLTQTAIIGLNVLSMFDALRILDDSRYLTSFDRSQTDALALSALDTHKYGYILGMTFFAVSTVVIGCLAWTSGRMPRALGALLVAAGACYLADSAMFFLVPGYDGAASPVVLAPALVAEVWFCLWLLTRGAALESIDRRAPEPSGTGARRSRIGASA